MPGNPRTGRPMPRAMRGAARARPPTLTSRERLLFEAGIKLGGIFHQYIGVPVSSTTAPGLARAIAAAVGLQPYVSKARVVIRPNRGGKLARGARFGYRYLTAEMLQATVTLTDGSATVRAHLGFVPELRYPLMRVLEARGARRRRTLTRGARRSGRRRGRSGRRTAPSVGSTGGRRTPRARGRSSRRPGSPRTAA
jgi:dihydroneopterin aldolase